MAFRRRVLGALAAAAFVALACAEADGPVELRLAPFASVEAVPPSGAGRLVALPGGRACTPDSYLMRVHCFELDTRRRWSFGREGEGPGEMKSPGPLLAVASSDSTLALVDWELDRVTVYRLDGAYLESGSVPLGFWPYSRVRSGRIYGTRIPFQMPDLPTEHVGRLTVLDLDRDGSPLEVELRSPRHPGEEDKLPFARGAILDDSTIIVHVAGHRFAEYTFDGRFRSEFEYPPRLQEPIYPSERDVEEWTSDIRQLFGRPPTATEIEIHAETPLAPILQGTNPAVGPDSTFWVASPRGRIECSYIDVFRSGAYLGALEVRDRLLAFSIQGDTLVALVVRTGADGEDPRALDWYDLEEALRQLRP